MVDFNASPHLRSETLRSESFLRAGLSAKTDVDTSSASHAPVVGRVFVIEQGHDVHAALSSMLAESRCDVTHFPDCASFLSGFQSGSRGCVVIDGSMLGGGGFEMIRLLKGCDHDLKTLIVSNNPTVPLVVRAMQAGACDLIAKPLEREEVLSSLRRCLSTTDLDDRSEFRRTASVRLASLTLRQQDVMERMLAGHSSKIIAWQLEISTRTVEAHRAAIARKLGSRSLPVIIETAICARCNLNPDNSPLE